jgi:hypothetical protein
MFLLHFSIPHKRRCKAFLTAAGYASASVLYNLDDPPFIHDDYTIGQFEVRGCIASG